MSTPLDLDQVNHCAKMSCPKWNRNKMSRRFHRQQYRRAAITWAKSLEGRRCASSNSIFHNVDTYPWPYRDPYFANWEEDDSDEGYNLISDQSGCVVKYSTSYCAWKIFETTGAWPQKTSGERLDAKCWVQFLVEAGYPEIVPNLIDDFYARRSDAVSPCYVGIKPDEGEWGLTVWFEELDSEFNQVFVSSYVDKRYKAWWIDPYEYIWVKIV